jgi:5-methylcytosine-specific restriction protein B
MLTDGLISESALQHVLAEADSPQVRSWVLAVLAAIRERFPRCDFYVLNHSNQSEEEPRIYIGVGARQLNTASGRNALVLVAKNNTAYLGFQRKGQFDLKYRSRVFTERLSAEQHTDLAEIKRWLEQLDLALDTEDRRALQGEARTLDDYLSSVPSIQPATAGAVAPSTSSAQPSLNQILYGPPGTGKTYATIEASLEVLDPTYLHEYLNNRSALKRRFDELVQQDRIRFVTFHQSFSYEDFVEGLRATTDEDSGQLRYDVVDGVFKSLCAAAAAKVTRQAEAPTELGQRRIWKMSLGNTLGEDASIYQECLAAGYVLLGYGGAVDFAGCANRQQVQARFAEAGVVPANPAADYGITSVTAFVSRMKVGDLIVVSDGNFKFRAIGEVTGDYQFKPHAEFEADYSQMRPVKWLRQYQPSLPHSELLNGQFSQMTLYELRSPTLDRDKLAALLGSVATESGISLQIGQRFGQGYVVRNLGSEQVEFEKPRGGLLPLPLSIIKQLLAYVRAGQLSIEDIRQGRVFEKVAEAELEKYIVNGYQSLFAALVEHLTLSGYQSVTAVDARVLIIDEINRGNISRIFGELITLIEPSKRAGAEEALSLMLPYSKQRFSVPANLYLIGTMNTADRSLAGLDIALRRRFVFREMPPRPDLLDAVEVQGLNIGQLLRVMNQRIEVLLDRDHCLGHAYFMPLKVDGSRGRLEAIFRNQVLPLLQEYFFEDWQRIAWVLNDHRKAAGDQFVQPRTSLAETLFGQEVGQGLARSNWVLNDDAFERLEAYLGILDPLLVGRVQAVKREVMQGEITLRELASGSIEVWRSGALQQPAKPILRELAEQLGVDLHNGNGNLLNTQSLGRRLISHLGNGAE